MKLTWEESSAARAILAESPNHVPVQHLAAELYRGRFERVARAAAVYFQQKLAGALEFYVLALLQSGHPNDIALAKHLLHEAFDEKPGPVFRPLRRKRTSAESYLQAAQWVMRFDLPRLGERVGQDLSLRMKRIAEFLEGMNERDVPTVLKSLHGIFEEGDARGLFALFLIRKGQLPAAFEVVRTGLESDRANPYLRMAGHQLFARVPKEQVMQVLLYRTNREPLALGVAGIPGSGILFKSHTGQGYLRNPAGLEIDTNYGPIAALSLKELCNEVRSDALPLAKTLKRKKKSLELEWGSWISEELAA